MSPVECLPEKGKAVFVDNISPHNGGCACNTAVALGKLGVSTAVIGRVGCGAFGDFLVKVIDEAGLDTAWDAEGRWMELLGPCLSHVGIFVPNLEEAQMLTGQRQPAEIAQMLLDYGVSTIVVKLGAEVAMPEPATMSLLCQH